MIARVCGCHAHRADAPDLARPAPVTPERTVGDVAQQYPAALPAMQTLGINHCCGAQLSLAEAAAAAGVPLDRLLEAIHRAIGPA